MTPLTRLLGRSSWTTAPRPNSTEVGAAVYMQGLAGHKAGVVRGQKNRGVRNFLRAGHAPERSRLRRLGELSLTAAIARLGGVGQSRRDRINPDPIGSQPQAHPPLHRQPPALAASVIHAPGAAPACPP